MIRVVKVTKVKRVIKVSDILRDLLNDVSDESILVKYRLTWVQLEKIYAKLFHTGLLSKHEMETRIELRSGKDASHIPYADLADVGEVYECTICGFSSPRHFSACPRCRQINLRRLRRRVEQSIVASGSPGYAAGS
jgi:hypothetical protein